jgi:hypothetical protein
MATASSSETVTRNAFFIIIPPIFWDLQSYFIIFTHNAQDIFGKSRKLQTKAADARYEDADPLRQ